MQPVTEYGAKSYFNKYEPGMPIGKQLGNTQQGDGYVNAISADGIQCALSIAFQMLV